MNDQTIIALTAGSILITKLHKLRELLHDLAMEDHSNSRELCSLRDQLDSCVIEFEVYLPAASRIADKASAGKDLYKQLMNAWAEFIQKNGRLEDDYVFKQQMEDTFSSALGMSVMDLASVEALHEGVQSVRKKINELGEGIEEQLNRSESCSDELMDMSHNIEKTVDHMPLPPYEGESFEQAFSRIFGNAVAEETMFMHRIRTGGQL